MFIRIKIHKTTDTTARESRTIQPVSVGNNTIEYTDEVRDLGVTYDHHMLMDQHILHFRQSAFPCIRYIGHTKKYLDKESAQKLVHAFVTSKLDYSNSLLYGLPGCKLERLQRLLNTAARIVTRTPDHD